MKVSVLWSKEEWGEGGLSKVLLKKAHLFKSLLQTCFLGVRVLAMNSDANKQRDATSVWFKVFGSSVYISFSDIWYCAEFYFRSK